MDKVKINSDSLHDIAALYGIGEVLAKRIIKYRETHGFFNGPDDLAKVEGIGVDLSQTLSPHVDWQIPTKLSKKKDRDIQFFFMFFLVAMYHIYFIFSKRVPVLLLALNDFFLDRPGGLVWIFVEAGLLANSFLLALFCLSWSGSELTTNVVLDRRMKKTSFVFAILALVSVVLIVIFNIIYYQFFAPSGWREFFTYKTNLNSAVTAAGFGLFVISIALSLWKPLFMFKDWLEWVSYISFFLIGLGGLTLPLTGGEFYPTWILGFYLIYGIGSILFGWYLIKEKLSVNDLLREIIQTWDNNIPEDSPASWQAWINIRLPNPDDQKALRDALNKSYAPSKAHSVIGILFISMGGWLIITIFASIVDWFVQRFLNSWLP